MWVAQDILTGWTVEVHAVDREGRLAYTTYRYVIESHVQPGDMVRYEYNSVVPMDQLAYLN